MKKQASVLFFLLFTFAQLQAQWIQTNGPYGGNICSIASFPNSSGGTSVLAGIGAQGIFLSTDNGLNWRQTSLKSGYVYSMTVSSNGAGGTNLFAATTGTGVFHSTDDGETWQEVNNGLKDLAAASLASWGTNLFAGTLSGVFLSTNNGESWSLADSSLKNIRAFAVTPNGNGGINLFAGTYGNGVFLSTDMGSTWKQTALQDKYIVTFAVSANEMGGTNLFAGGDLSAGVFLSTDQGLTWKEVNNGLATMCVRSLAISGTELFAGTYGGGVFHSTNNGTSWQQVNDGITNTAITSLAVSSNETGGINLFAGAYGSGVFFSSDNGAHWRHSAKGIIGTSPQALAYIDGTNIIAGALYGGVFLSTDNGTNWNQEEIQNNVISLALSKMGNGNISIFAGTYCSGVLFSMDKGSTWLPTGLTGKFISALAVSPDGEGRANLFAAAANEGVYFSDNNGVSWTNVNSGLTYLNIFSFAITPDNSGGSNLFAGTLGSGIFRLTSNGTEWEKLNMDLTGQSVYVRALASSGKNLFAGTWNGIFLSTDNGTSWKEVNTGLLDRSVISLIASGTNLFAGTNSGVFLSTDNGSNWASAGLTTSAIYALTISPTHLFAADYAGYVWKRPLSELISSIWQNDITIKDNGNISQQLSFGQLTMATDTLDAELEETPLPPPAFGFDARLHLPGGDDSWKDFRPSSEDSIEWLIKFQPGDGGYPITFSWDNTKLPEGSFYLKDIITGSVVNADMRNINSYTLTNSGINTLKIVFGKAQTLIGGKDLPAQTPNKYYLKQNYPNPFNPHTIISYGLPQSSRVRIKIYNSIGKEVEVLVNDLQNAGYHEITWNASNNASGVYFCTIEAVSEDGKTNFQSAKKLILMK